VDRSTPAAPERRSVRARFTRRYGGGPLHLFATAAGLALGGYVVSILFHVGHRDEILAWVAGAIIAHDLVLFPLYSALDRVLGGLASRHRGEHVVPWRNHVRAPAVIAGILLLMTFPLVFNLSEKTYLRATGLTTSVYLLRWATVAGTLFAGSAVVYGVRIAFAVRRKRVGGGRSAR